MARDHFAAAVSRERLEQNVFVCSKEIARHSVITFEAERLRGNQLSVLLL